ncbi:MAG TPA: D-alanyl-D-alanine carboxypeptidase/D-alanyl-D-alanine-endopeptidase [Pyrinomonadaceae bacterium]|nr:D-alanyl-D-alanine carboxypeptidase/D-alanyl-D-alanine-endopeptidase [Pyrinomonadaceae bacterium]
MTKQHARRRAAEANPRPSRTTTEMNSRPARTRARSLVALLCCALACAALPAAPRAQSPQRERRVATPTPTPTPQTARPTPTPQTVRPTPTPAAPQTTPTPARSVVPQATPTPEQPLNPTPTPQASPTPAPQPTPAPTPGPRSLEVLRARMSELLASPALAPAHFAVKVVSLDTGATLFEENAGKLLMPASNMKIYTVAAALDRLGPDFRFATSVYSAAPPDDKGRVKGDLVIYGRGDPSFATRFAGEGDYFKGVEALAEKIAAAGVRRIEGDIVGDESYFDGPALGWGWEWDDLAWYYGAPVSALTVNDNAVDLSVKPGEREGAAAVVTAGPSFLGFPVVVSGAGVDASSAARNSPPLLSIINRATTSARGTPREITIDRPLGQDYVEVWGTIPADDPGQTVPVAVPRPALMFAAMLRAALERRGVQTRGRTASIDARTRELQRRPFDPAPLVELARRESPPLREIAAHTMKPSQNLYTELILRTLGKQSSAPPPEPGQAANRRRTSAQLGHAVVRQFLREAGVPNVERLSLVDASGLARQNLITAEATVQLLTYMSRRPNFQVWLDSQPVAGVDGTLRGRMRGTMAAGNLRAKTGTISNVSALSGYVTTAAGERLAFSIIVNHYTDAPGVPPRTNFLDGIAALLASFGGRSTAVTGQP